MSLNKIALKLPQIALMTEVEVYRAESLHGTAPWGRHEFYGILAEEFQEVQKAVFENQSDDELLTEIIQVMAVCARFLSQSESR